MTRLQSIIERVERDEPIQWQKELDLYALEFARSGEQFADECLQREREADDNCKADK